MSEPVTLTVGAIVALAFTKFIESSSTAVANKLTPNVLEKIDNLRVKILKRLGGIPEIAAISQQSSITERQVQLITPHLEKALRDDSEFAKEIRKIANEVHQEINIGQVLGKDIQNVYGGSAVQINNPEAPIFTGDISGGDFDFTWNK